MQSKNLKRLDKIVRNLNEKECERFRKMLLKDGLLGGSKCNDHVHDFLLLLLLKINFLTLNIWHW